MVYQSNWFTGVNLFSSMLFTVYQKRVFEWQQAHANT